MKVSPDISGLVANSYLSLDTLTKLQLFLSCILMSTEDNILLTPILCETPKVHNCMTTVK